jgi:hypothetical protein
MRTNRIVKCIVLFALLSTMAGCSSRVNLSGAEFEKTTGGASYKFQGNQATWSLTPSKSALEVAVPLCGEGVAESYDELPDSANAYMTLSGSSTQSMAAVKFFLPSSKEDWKFNTDGDISNSDGSRSNQIYVETTDIKKLEERPGDYLEELYNNGGRGALYYAPDGTKFLHAEALPKILSSLKDNQGGTFCIVVRCKTQVVYKKGEWVEVATVPVTYDKTTITLDWSEATYDSRFKGKWLEEMKTQGGTERCVYRVEDDQKFIFNPETESRWKRK